MSAVKINAVKLWGLNDPVEWQCAHDAVRHAEPDRRIILEYETPNGDLKLIVTVRKNVAHVKKRDRV